MPYVPKRGDVIWITLNPQVGHEQAGRRPALVLSPASYNLRSGLAVVCPITSQVKNYPFEVRIPEELEVTGVILADQVKSLDWQVRDATFFCSITTRTLNEVGRKLSLLLP